MVQNCMNPIPDPDAPIFYEGAEESEETELTKVKKDIKNFRDYKYGRN